MAHGLLARALMRPLLLIAAATCALSHVALPRLAQACSGVPCTLPAAFPVPEGGELPANFGELTVFSESVFPRAAGYTLKLWEAGSPDRLLRTVEVGVSNHNRAQLGDLLAAGKSYVVEASSCGDRAGSTFVPVVRTLHFKLAHGPSAPPTTLGPLAISRHEPTKIPWSAGAGCFEYLDSDAVDLVLELSALPAPWRKLVNSYQLMVDGEPFSWTLTQGSDDYGPRDRTRGFYFDEPGPFRAFTECEPSRSSNLHGGPASPDQKERGLEPGKHTAWIAARVPTSPAQIVESQRIEVELACPQPDAGVTAVGSATSSTDSGGDAELSDGDSGVDRTAAPEEGAATTEDPSSTDASGASVDNATKPEASGSCALSPREREAKGPPLGLLLLALALLRRRQAVRRRHTPRRSPD